MPKLPKLPSLPKEIKNGLNSLRVDPPIGFHFNVSIVDNMKNIGGDFSTAAKTLVDGSFQEVSGISVEMGTFELAEGGENRFTYKLPLGVKYSPLQLKRGLVSSFSALGEWCKEVFTNGLEEPITTKNILVSLLDEQSLPLTSWVFEGAYPTKWSVSNFNAMNSEIVIESMELTYRRFEQVG